jgi:hypothetical protein
MDLQKIAALVSSVTALILAVDGVLDRKAKRRSKRRRSRGASFLLLCCWFSLSWSWLLGFAHR